MGTGLVDGFTHGGVSCAIPLYACPDGARVQGPDPETHLHRVPSFFAREKAGKKRGVNFGVGAQ